MGTDAQEPSPPYPVVPLIERHYDALEDNPYLYAPCAQPLLRRGGYRRIAINVYLLFYRVDEAQRIVYVERFFSELQDYADKL